MASSDNTGARPGAASAAGRVPRSTYRVQMHRGFTFRDATAIVPYLKELGVGDLYASPYLQARPGSMHGYDITDHGSLNQEIGTEEDHARMAAVLREHGMGHLLDVVPNHMGIAGHTNPWWWDVLEAGPDSQHAAAFDIDWRPRKPELEGKVLLPILGDQYGRVLERGELRLVYDDGRFRLEYFDNRFPVAPASTAAVLREALARLDGVLDEDHPDRMELESIATALERLPARRRTDPQSVAERRREKLVTQRRLSGLHALSPRVAFAVDRAVERFNGRPGDARSFDRLDALLDEQAYRLAFWRVAAEEINYRRFFDVNELAGVRIEVPHVFQETHRLILRLVREGKVTGLRIDHPDGLFDPLGYLRSLQQETAGIEARERFYVVVEKILAGDEPLPDWPVAGAVGYEFLNRLNGLFVDGANESAIDGIYRRFTGLRDRYRDLVYEKKLQILRFALVSELTVLTTMLSRIADANRRYRDFTWGALREALREVVACFPVYRTYIDAFAGEVSDRDRAYVEEAVHRAERRSAAVSPSLFHFIRDVLLLRWPESLEPELREEHARFVMKLQQLTGPVMAKGVEDTAFYVFNRLVSLNEVGGEPDRFGTSADEFHLFNLARAERWPGALSATSTHDTKRGEDVRVRIDVLSEMPEHWNEALLRWREMNALRKAAAHGEPVPDANDEYLLYQTLVGAWPLGEMDQAAHAEFVRRIQQYMDKATREAKVHTSWINPNEEYDRGLAEFVGAILERGGDFARSLAEFQRPVARMGMVNALAQTLLKIASPGVPDVYQGQEVWDFSLVDPDNRRPVDYQRRRKMLSALRERMHGDRAALCGELVEAWEDGRIKLYVTHVALCAREAHAEAFAAGEYLPLAATGDAAAHVVAFARRGGGSTLLAVAPRLVATLQRHRRYALPDARSWAGTRLAGDAVRGRWRNLFTGEEHGADDGGLALDEVLARLPVALLERVG